MGEEIKKEGSKKWGVLTASFAAAKFIVKVNTLGQR